MVDKAAIADHGADAEVTLDERWQRARGGAGVDRGGGEAVHRDMVAVMRPGAQLRRRQMVMVEVRQFGGVEQRIGAVQRGAAEHMADVVRLEIGSDAAPEQRDGGIVAPRRGNAAAAEFEQLPAGDRLGDQWREVIFAGGIETVVRGGDRLAQQAIGADDMRAAIKAVIDDEQMVADHVIRIDIAAFARHGGSRSRPHFIIEDLVAQRLGGGDFGLGDGEADIELADAVDEGCRGEQLRGNGGRTAEGETHEHRLRWRHHGGAAVALAGFCDSRGANLCQAGDTGLAGGSASSTSPARII